MVWVLKNSSNIKELRAVLKKRQYKNGFDAKKFNGALKVNEDALLVQKRLRNEWN